MQNSIQRPSDTFSRKYSLYSDMMFRICMVFLGNKEDVEEAMQESFFRLVYKSPQFSDAEYEKAWLIRIMTYGKFDGTTYTEFFECFNGITVKTGEDLFSKLKIENNIKPAKQEKFDSWNNNKQQYKELTKLQVLNSFVEGLKNTVPYTQKSLSYLFDDNEETKQKFVYIILNDNSDKSI